MSNLDALVRLHASGPASPRLRVVWAALLALTALTSAAALLCTPFSAEEGEFIHALRSGEITTVAVGHSSDFASGGFNTTGFNTNGSNAPNDVAVSWVNRFGFRRLADLSQLGELAQLADDQGDETNPSTASKAPLDPSATIARTARSLGVAAPRVVQPGGLRFDRLNGLSVLLTILMIGVLMYGPQPRRKTKWGAFWSYLIPYSLGILWALLRDSPWNRRMSLLPEPAAGERVVVDPITGEGITRYGGWTMFFVSAVIASIALSLVLLGVAWAFPTHLDPVVWSAVDVAGHPMTL